MEHILGNAANATIDVDVNNFMTEVVEGSTKQPVVVQFWAPWCGLVNSLVQSSKSCWRGKRQGQDGAR